ncbi:MAG: erythromycin esterase family protein [Janthinobacterium lividum]
MRFSDELVQHLQAVAAPAAVQQHGQVLRQRAGLLLAANGITMRDQAMALNLAWLLQQEPAAKVVVWAHNIHIQRAKCYPLMGQYLSRQLGPAYVAVGFATGHGTASVFNPNESARTLVLAPPLSDSFEMWLDQAAPPNYFLNLHSAVAADKWLATSRKFRNTGEKELPGGAEGQFMVGLTHSAHTGSREAAACW